MTNTQYAHFTHSMQRTCFLYSLYIVHTDSQLYFDIYKMGVQNKWVLCKLYTVVCAYSIHIAYIDILYVISLLFTF